MPAVAAINAGATAAAVADISAPGCRPTPRGGFARDGSLANADPERNSLDDDAVPSVLARRLGEVITNHEPGWPLPRVSILARMFDVTEADMTAALGELDSARVITRKSAGRYRRMTPAEYRLVLDRHAGLQTQITPVSSSFACTHRTVTWRPVRHYLERVLGIPPGEHGCVIRMSWASAGETVALSTAYLTRDSATTFAAADGATELSLQAIVPIRLETDVGEERAPAAVLTSLHAEMQQLPGWASTALRLAAFERALIVTAAFSDPSTAAVVAVTVAMLRPDAFRLTASSPRPALSNALLPSALAECADYDDQPGYAGSEALGSMPFPRIGGAGRSRMP